MKDNLEKAFKSSLEEYEVPYDPKAWDAVNKQLNANAAGGSTLLSSAMKWVLASVLFGTVVAGSYFLWYNDGSESAQQALTIENKKETTPSIDKEETSTNGEVLVDEKADKIEVVEPIETKSQVLPEIAENKTATHSKQALKKEGDVKTQENTNLIDQNTPPEVPNKVVFNSENYSSGHISTPIVCLGESIEISNNSKKDKVRFQFKNKWIVLKSGKSYSFTPEESTVINFVNNNDELIEAKYIKVNELPTPDFNLEANIYEGGMPVVIAEAYGDYVNYSWNFDEEDKGKGAVVRCNFFEKGDYEITLNVEDVNGCLGSTTKSIRIRDKFNLMAVDAFKPNGADVRNRTFMPYSLTERDVRFQMTIVDPLDNGIVFTSSDAEDAWDGTDQRTGKLTPSNKSFIWKVQIFDPVPNERPIYAGTVVHN